MAWPLPVTLKGSTGTLAPLSLSHAADLAEAAADGKLWKLWYTSVPKPDAVRAEIERRLSLQEAGSMLPFAVLTPTGKAVGMTTYMNIDAANKRVEIGSTWYRKAVQRTRLNTECKRMLLALKKVAHQPQLATGFLVAHVYVIVVWSISLLSSLLLLTLSFCFFFSLSPTYYVR